MDSISVRIDNLVKGGAKRRRLRRSTTLDKIVNANKAAIRSVQKASLPGHSLDTLPSRSLLSPACLARALSSAGERSLHTGEVVGSIPTAPTRLRCFAATAGKPAKGFQRSREGCALCGKAAASSFAPAFFISPALRRQSALQTQRGRHDGRPRLSGLLLVVNYLLIVLAAAVQVASSCEPVPPEQPMAPMSLPPSISGMPPREAMTSSSVKM